MSNQKNNNEEMELEINDYTIDNEFELSNDDTEISLDDDSFSDDEVILDEAQSGVDYDETEDFDSETKDKSEKDITPSNGKEPMAKSQKIFLVGAGFVVVGLAGFLGWTFLGNSHSTQSYSNHGVNQLAPIQQSLAPLGIEPVKTTIKPIEPPKPLAAIPKKTESSIKESATDTSPMEKTAPIQKGSTKTFNSVDKALSEPKVDNKKVLTKLDSIKEIAIKSSKENTHLNKAQVLALNDILSISKEIKSSLTNNNSNKDIITQEELKSLQDKLADSLALEESLKSKNNTLEESNNLLKEKLKNYKIMLSKTFARIKNLKKSRHTSSSSKNMTHTGSSNKTYTLKGMSNKIAIFEDKKGNSYHKQVGDSIGNYIITKILPEEGIVKTKTSQFKIN